MGEVLADIRSGAFADRFIADQDAGAPEFAKLRAEGEQHSIEATGSRAAHAYGVGQDRRRLHRGHRLSMTGVSRVCPPV